MLNFSFASLLMAIVTSNLFIIVLTLIFINQSVMREFGFSLLGMICTLVFIRMLFPFEFAHMTKNINLPWAASKIVSFMRCPRIPVLGYSCSFWDFFVIIWGIGFLVLFFQYVSSIKDTYNFIYKYGVDVTDSPGYKSALCKTVSDKKLQDKITILQLPLIQSPAVFRYYRHYYILMPDGLVLDEEEQEFIFRHEVSHIMHHDITLKFFLQVICLFYWWNPFCYILKKRSSLLFELRVDSSVASQGDEQIRQYISCLIKVSKHGISGSSGISMPSAVKFSLKMESDTFIRVCFLLENKKTKNKILTRLISLPLCIIYIFSFIFIFEGYYINTDYIKDGQEITSENTYFVKNKDNTYDVYFYGEHIDTASSLEYYPDDCKIYLSLKEAKKNEEN
ncbi:MAG: M56 family metallopeptidase [Lachnospiraceae bacterium]|nr:M56 family metallopeptidase [Lachnospiraceae bacterium]